MLGWNSSNLVVSFHETSPLYSSKHRRNNFQKLVARLAEAISKKSHLLYHDTDCIWIRDWFPINLEDRLVIFQVATDYMDHHEAHQVIKNQNLIRSRFPFIPDKPIISSNIILDGGNVVMDSEHAIISTKVMRDNHLMSVDQVVGQLSDLLSRKIILIEAEEDDPTGHADGQCQFLADGILLINDLSRVAPEIWKRNLARIQKAQLSIVALAYNPSDMIAAGWPSLECNYINFTGTEHDIVFSSFGDERTEARVLRAVTDIDPLHRHYTFIRTHVIDELGGGLHCMTWNC